MLLLIIVHVFQKKPQKFKFDISILLFLQKESTSCIIDKIPEGTGYTYCHENNSITKWLCI